MKLTKNGKSRQKEYILGEKKKEKENERERDVTVLQNTKVKEMEKPKPKNTVDAVVVGDCDGDDDVDSITTNRLIFCVNAVNVG